MDVSRTGSINSFNSQSNAANTSISIPADAQFIVVTVGGWINNIGYFSSGSLTLNSSQLTISYTGDASTSTHMGMLYYYNVSAWAGTSQTLAWDWNDTYPPVTGANFFYAFYKGIDGTSPIRSSGGESVDAISHTTGSLAATSGDMLVGLSSVTSNVTDLSVTGATETANYVLFSNRSDFLEANPTAAVTVTVAANNGDRDGTVCALVFKAEVTALTYIAAAQGIGDAAGTSLNTSASLTIEANDLLVAIVTWEDGSLADTANVTYNDGSDRTLTNTTTVGQGAPNAIMRYSWLIAPANGTSAFTYASTSREFRRIQVLQFRASAGATISLDPATSNPASAGASSTSVASGAITTTGTDTVVIGAIRQYGSSTYSSKSIGGSAATTPTEFTDNQTTAFYRILTSGMSSGTATATLGASRIWVSEVMGFKAVAADTTAPLRLRFLIDSTGDTTAKSFQLEYKKVGDSIWDKVIT